MGGRGGGGRRRADDGGRGAALRSRRRPTRRRRRDGHDLLAQGLKAGRDAADEARHGRTVLVDLGRRRQAGVHRVVEEGVEHPQRRLVRRLAVGRVLPSELVDGGGARLRATRTRSTRVSGALGPAAAHRQDGAKRGGRDAPTRGHGRRRASRRRRPTRGSRPGSATWRSRPCRSTR